MRGCIDDLLGIAMGCIGMNLSDFCCCTPSEFNAAYAAWHEREERVIRNGWEETRVMCQCALQPYSKRKLSARDVFPLPWDERDEEEEEEVLTEEERRQRYEAAKKRYGIE